MLKRLYANKASFREITFRPNSLNIILAEKHKNTAATASRNGLGKSTFVNIICFCLGINVDLTNDLPLSELPGWKWTLEIDIQGNPYSITRGTDQPNTIFVRGNLEKCPIAGVPSDDGLGTWYEEKAWRNVLCWYFFGLSPQDALGQNGAARPPEYQSLMSHFVRRYFDDPVRVKWSDSRVNSELAITYLLGLDWQYLAQAKELRAKDREAEEKINAARARMQEWKSKNEALETECKVLLRKIEEAEAALKKFNTTPHKLLVEDSSEALTKAISRLERKLLRNKRILESARKSKRYNYVSFEPVTEFYSELGITFTEGAKRTYEEVRSFHDKLTVNRGALLDDQIAVIEEENRQLSAELKKLEQRREKLTAALKSNDMFEEYTRRTSSLAQFKEEYAVKMDCLRQLQNGEEGRRLTETERVKLVQSAQELHEKLRPIWEAESKQFASIVNQLYSDAIPPANVGETTLGIKIRKDSRDCGISYAPHFWGDRSEGKKKLKAFAFDLVILAQQKEIKTAVDFMIHDSVLYESSDSRQYAKALMLVSDICTKQGVQYISVMNSDDVTTDDFKAIMSKEVVDAHVIHRLTDTLDGSQTLLGEFFPKDNSLVESQTPKE